MISKVLTHSNGVRKRIWKLEIGGENIRVEVQSGFQGVNDIREQRVREAKRLSVLDGTKNDLHPY